VAGAELVKAGAAPSGAACTSPAVVTGDIPGGFSSLPAGNGNALAIRIPFWASDAGAVGLPQKCGQCGCVGASGIAFWDAPVCSRRMLRLNSPALAAEYGERVICILHPQQNSCLFIPQDVRACKQRKGFSRVRNGPPRSQPGCSCSMCQAPESSTGYHDIDILQTSHLVSRYCCMVIMGIQRPSALKSNTCDART